MSLDQPLVTLATCGLASRLWRRVTFLLVARILHGSRLSSCRRNCCKISRSEGRTLETEEKMDNRQSIPDTWTRLDRKMPKGPLHPVAQLHVGVMGSGFYHLWLGPRCYQLTSAIWSQEPFPNLSVGGDVRIIKLPQTGITCHLRGGSV